MKLSELRPIVKEAHRLGLKKVPKEKRWVNYYTFYECTARFYISNLELIYSRIPLQTILNMEYDKFWKQYQEEFGAHDYNFESLTINIQEEK